MAAIRAQTALIMRLGVDREARVEALTSRQSLSGFRLRL